MQLSSSSTTQEDGALAEAVSKAKSKKERIQNKVVLDVAHLFTGNSLYFIRSNPFPLNISNIIILTSTSKVPKSFVLPHFFLSRTR